MDPAKLSVPPTATIRETIAAINRGEIGLALVTEREGQLLGLATDGDIRLALLRGATLETEIGAVMCRDPVTAPESASIEEIRRLSSREIRHIPVLDPEGCVVDIATFLVDIHIPLAEPYLSDRALRYVTDCITSKWISSAGPYVQRFELEFAQFCEARYGITTCNGTAALHLTLAALGIGPGDEVIVPTLSFVATANVVRYVGATPVFVDSEPRTWNLDPQAVERAISPRTKVIIPVHLYGHPADMDHILEVARPRDIAVIEDAAEAHGAEHRGRRVGALGLAGCFSFYGNKIITTGEGGMVVTNDEGFADRLRFLRDHAMDPSRRYWHTEVGFNYRMTNLQAALGVAQVEEIDGILERKLWQGRVYRQLLAHLDVTLPPEEPWAKNVYWMFSVLLPMPSERIISSLGERRIDSRPFFSPIHLMPMYGGREGDFPVAEDLAARGINLPSAVEMTAEEMRVTARELQRALEAEHEPLRSS